MGASPSLLESPRARWVAAGLTLALGLFFTLVWAPHPWGWRGIDQYHQLAAAVARGEPFGTTDVPWAYTYYVGFFYALFGEQAWIPVVVQVVINAAVPLLLYAVARPLTDRRTAGLAALLIGVFSFNTVYASTQSSDALCTVTFLGALLALGRAYREQHLGWYALSGALSGLMPQFRPNLILLPLVAAVVVVLLARARRRTLVGSAVYLALFAALLTPWTVRNYRLTETFLPSSSHGGIQLWYGSLQPARYLESRVDNPRALFDAPAFDYFSLAGPSLVVSASTRGCAPSAPERVTLWYRTDRDPSPRRAAVRTATDPFTFEIPGQAFPTVVYYWFDTTWRTSDGSRAFSTPAGGATTPLVFFVSDDHLGDLDRHDDLLDVFDVAHLVQQLAWHHPTDATLDVTGDGEIAGDDLTRLVAALAPSIGSPALAVGEERATLTFSDSSTFSVPRHFARVTDLVIAGAAATALAYAREPRWRLETALPPAADRCLLLEDIVLNQPFYRREPHLMRRYTALALDNIAADPAGFIIAAAYRAGRLFLIWGTSDQLTTQQFRSSGLVYAGGTVLSAVYFLLFAAGAVIGWRRRSPVLLLLIPILYIPATIAVVLTNMRYTITVQPLMFIFVAVALLALGDRAGAAPSRADDKRGGRVRES